MGNNTYSGTIIHASDSSLLLKVFCILNLIIQLVSSRIQQLLQVKILALQSYPTPDPEYPEPEKENSVQWKAQ